MKNASEHLTTTWNSEIIHDERIDLAKKIIDKLNKMQRVEMSVFANQLWQPSGLKVLPGDMIIINSSGQWSISGKITNPAYGLVDAAGHSANNSWGHTIYEGNIGSLIISISGNTSRCFSGNGKFKALF